MEFKIDDSMSKHRPEHLQGGFADVEWEELAFSRAY